MLWRRDQDAAKAVLLHELGHHRHGEQHIAGLGSPFVALIRSWPYVFVLFGLLPTALLFAAGNPTAPLIVAQVVLVVLRVPSALILPVSALWTAELAADRYAATVRGRRNLLTALSAIEAAAPSRLAGLHHPPVRMRRWFVRCADRRSAHLLLVLLLPAAALADVLPAVAGAVVSYHLLGASWDSSVWKSLALAHHELAGGAQWWAVLAALVLWPLLAGVWPRLWGWRGRLVGAFSVRAYATAALLPAVVLAVGLMPEGDKLARAGATEPWSQDTPATAPSPSAPGGAPTSPCPTVSAPAPPARPEGLPSFAGADASMEAGDRPNTGRQSFRTSRTVSAEPLIGTPSQLRGTRDRLARARWTLAGDGTLTTDSDGLQLRTIAIDGDTRILRGERTVVTAVSATTTWAEARLHGPLEGSPELTLIRAATSVMHAVVNCESFDSTVTAAARFVLVLDRS